MPTVSRTFDVAPAPDTVIPYLADFGNAEQWDPGTESCVRNGEGPVEVGASWHNTSKIAGISTELTYRLERLDEQTIVFVGRNDTAMSTETIEVVAQGTGSTVTYTNDLEFEGAAKLAAPISKVVFEKLGNDTEEQLVEVLDALDARSGDR